MKKLPPDQTAPRPSVVTIGSFDGVHRGHQALIQEALDRARKRDADMWVMTFDPHPAMVLRGIRHRFLITPGELKDIYLDWAGALGVTVIPFTPAFSHLSAEDFLEREIRQRMRAVAVVVGFNFTFGARGLGTVTTLQEWAATRGIEVVVKEPVQINPNRAASSSSVREAISAGQLDAAEAVLGHAFSVQRPIQRGDQRGRALGFRTLNLVPPAEQVMPPFGVYAGYVLIESRPIPAVANWGIRPTFGGEDPVLEIHGLDGPLQASYGDVARFDFAGFIREERRFPSPEALTEQIRLDVDQARRILAKKPWRR
ncbi:MAG: riboflavin biosynthesis protein RibF [Sulfobacillus sp.]|nr:riboflavin biosynthesis protein RibF [Sulfobacillus sp.]